MVNYIVDDLDALLDRLKQEGVKIDPKRMNAFYDHFAWIYDSDGNKIELWQPSAEAITLGAAQQVFAAKPDRPGVLPGDLTSRAKTSP